MDKFAALLTLILLTALATTLVMHENTAGVIGAIGDNFAKTLRALIGSYGGN